MSIYFYYQFLGFRIKDIGYLSLSHMSFNLCIVNFPVISLLIIMSSAL